MMAFSEDTAIPMPEDQPGRDMVAARAIKSAVEDLNTSVMAASRQGLEVKFEIRTLNIFGLGYVDTLLYKVSRTVKSG
jgi:hypothetical protein